MTEKEIVSKMHDMCVESLSPEIFVKWERLKLHLEKVRESLIEIYVTDTKLDSCCNCRGMGPECEAGFSWIYCTVRRENDDLFDGDCGEAKGCNLFLSRDSSIEDLVTHCCSASYIDRRGNSSEARCNDCKKVARLVPTE